MLIERIGSKSCGVPYYMKMYIYAMTQLHVLWPKYMRSYLVLSEYNYTNLKKSSTTMHLVSGTSIKFESRTLGLIDINIFLRDLCR